MKRSLVSLALLATLSLTACYDSNVIPEFCNTWPIEWFTPQQAQNFLQGQSPRASRQPQSAISFQTWQRGREIWVIFRAGQEPQLDAVRRILRHHNLGTLTYRTQSRSGIFRIRGGDSARFQSLFQAVLEVSRLSSVQTISEASQWKIAQDSPTSVLASECAPTERALFPISNQVTPLALGWAGLSQAMNERMKRLPSRPTTVVVADTGVDGRHADLHVAQAANFVIRPGQVTPVPSESGDQLPISSPNYSHGTKAAGIIAAQDNGIGVLGIQPAVRLENWRTTSGEGTASMSSMLFFEALDRLYQGRALSIVNISGASTNFHEGYARELARIRDKVIVVASAGNQANPSGQVYPGRYPGVVAVGFTNAAGELDPSSAREDWVTLVAPGRQILTTYAGSRYACVAGSSFATPIVTGAFALAARKFPAYTADALRKQVICNSSGRGRKFQGSQVGKGFGVLSIDSALNGSQQSSPQGCEYEPGRDGILVAAELSHPAPVGLAPETMPDAAHQLIVRDFTASAFRFQLGMDSASAPNEVQGLLVSFRVQDGSGRAVAGARASLNVENASGGQIIAPSDPMFVTGADGLATAVLLGPKCGTVRVRVVGVTHAEADREFIANSGETIVSYQFEAVR